MSKKLITVETQDKTLIQIPEEKLEQWMKEQTKPNKRARKKLLNKLLKSVDQPKKD